MNAQAQQNPLEPRHNEMKTLELFMGKVTVAGLECNLNPAQYLKCLTNIMASVVADHSTIDQTKYIDDLDALIDKYKATKLLYATVGKSGN